MVDGKLSQDTFQLPAAEKERVTEVASRLGYFRNGAPSRSRVYREFVAFALANLSLFLKWREQEVRARFGRKRL